MKIGEWDNLGRARGLVQRQLGELGAAEYAAHVTVNPDNGRLRVFVATDAAPWFVIPADRKWYRDLAVAEILAEAAREMDPQWPEPEEDLSTVVVPE